MLVAVGVGVSVGSTISSFVGVEVWYGGNVRVAVEVAVRVGIGVRIGVRVPTALEVAVEMATGVPDAVGLGRTGCGSLCVEVGVNVGWTK